MDDGFIGEIRMFGGTFAPRSWAFCDGQLLAISSNSALFSILGTIYGGDGRTTFGLPGARGRVPLQHGTGAGLPNYNLGQRGGNYQTTLITANMPSHNHGETMKVADGQGNAFGGAGNYLANQAVDVESSSSVEMYKTAATATFNPAATLNGLELQNSGSQQSYTNMPAYQGINYIICLFGTYPSRN